MVQVTGRWSVVVAGKRLLPSEQGGICFEPDGDESEAFGII